MKRLDIKIFFRLTKRFYSFELNIAETVTISQTRTSAQCDHFKPYNLFKCMFIFS